MKLAAAQLRSIAGDIPANLAMHVEAVRRAIELVAELALFPELSLTGYEPTLAKRLAAPLNDCRFDPLQSLSESHAIVICAGIPLVVDTGVEIGMLLFQPGSPRQIYSKQLLHADELPYVVCGNGQTLLQKGGHTLAPAICFESLQPQHAATAASIGADVYLASVAKSAAGVAKAYAHYPLIAKWHSMTVVMANCLGPSDNFIGAGRSAVWNSHGELVGQLDDQHEGVLVFDTETQEIATATW
jgi:predicted amidohydrolase